MIHTGGLCIPAATGLMDADVLRGQPPELTKNLQLVAKTLRMLATGDRTLTQFSTRPESHVDLYIYVNLNP